MNSDVVGFLQAICANPDDDAVRLIYADWLDEHGESDRAEFIRVQCELAAILGECDRGPEKFLPPPTDGRLTSCTDAGCMFPSLPETWCSFHRLRCREQELIGFLQPYVADAIRTLFGKSFPGSWGWHWKRGFVHAVALPAADWIQQADAILAAQPVREVTLTTWPVYSSMRRSHPPDSNVYWFHGREKTYNLARRFDRWQDVPPALLAAEWPGIRFSLPVDFEDFPIGYERP